MLCAKPERSSIPHLLARSLIVQLSGPRCHTINPFPQSLSPPFTLSLQTFSISVALETGDPFDVDPFLAQSKSKVILQNREMCTAFESSSRWTCSMDIATGWEQQQQNLEHCNKSVRCSCISGAAQSSSEERNGCAILHVQNKTVSERRIVQLYVNIFGGFINIQINVDCSMNNYIRNALLSM